ncbi:tetratricopeptide (TPR) repeat protein [Kitasatospora sp. MAP12-15]|uniref:tetratricopeptide repeat protein n=1 Tax=unclassified Kitasatospora TaxID=2633591 RepID=UPI002475AEC8|nr:tetratricopeptide repeat protein [Kitasatospora sp. MAP12-44]MDH6109834.1 tetratricopeptide (TPR) repeat protein [Kitasatospora sp. MAP12-44]
MTADDRAQPTESTAVNQGRAFGHGRVYQASRDQLITEHHHHYAGPEPVPWPSPDSVRVARADRPPRILRNRCKLRQTLGTALLEGGSIQVVHGMGGSGKTSLAHWAFQEAQRSGRIGLWVTASDRMSLRAAMLAVAADRGAAPGELLAAHHGHRAAADLVWHYLDRSAQPWLLVIDNADEPAFLEEGGWLRSSAGGTVLVTSRHATTPVWRGAAVHQLDLLPLEDAAQVLCDLAPDTGDLEQARAVARRLGCLPLALDLAGSYLANQLLESWTMGEYFDHLQDDDATSLIDQGAELRSGARESRQLVSRTWQLTLDALSAQGIPEATALLRLLSCWAPDPLPVAVLARGAADGAQLDALTPPLPSSRLEAALRALLDNSLTALQEFPTGPDGANTRCVQVHAVLLDSVHAGMPPLDRDAYVRAATALLATALPEAGHRGVGSANLRLLVPHVTALLQRTAATAPSATLRLAVATAQQIHEVGDYQAALALAELTAQTALRAHGADHPDTLLAQHQQGDSLRRLGRLREAEQLLREVLGRREEFLGHDHPDTLQSAAVLSTPLYLLGQREESLALLERAISGQRGALGDNHLETLRSRALVLEFLVDAGRFPDFLANGPATVADCEQFLGPDHGVTAIAYSNYAYGLLHAGTPQDAHAAAARALAARIRHHGTEHPLVYSAKLVLSWALMRCGSHQEAVALMRTAAAGRERLLGTDHPLSVKARILLAERLAAAGQPQEARQLFDGNIAAATQTYGPGDPDLTRVRLLFPE